MEKLVKYFVPEKYALDIAIDKHTKTIGGVVTVKGAAKDESVKFHVVGLEVDKVSVNGKNTKFEVADGILSVFKVPRSDLTIEIGYHGHLNENMQGAYLSTYEYNGETEVIVATQFESHYAREAFPCIDEPGAKAEFDLAITVPEKDLKAGDIILANTPEKDRKVAGKTRGNSFGTRVEFETTPRMSTYLLAWVIGKFHGKTVKNEHGVEITTYTTLNQDIDAVDFANEIAARSLEFYDDNFGVPYPLEKLDQVALPDFEAGAMENWGLVTYRESMLLAGKTATLGTKKGVALTVAHELSHQWFGDLVTMEWWDDLWLNESFASVMEYYAVDYIHPEYKIFEGFFTGDCYSALVRDAYTDVQSVHQDVNDPAEIATLFDGAIVYSKGAHLMLMLIRLMGWENFCKGVRDYFKKFQYKNTVGDDLWECLKVYADFDPSKLMHAFIDKPGYPVITDGKQQRFLLDGPIKDEKWPLPSVTSDMSGHYIINLSEDEFNNKLDKFDELSLEEKIRLLIDRNLLARTNLASAASLVPLIRKFSSEDKAAVWNILLSIVGNLKLFFDDESDEEKRFKKLVGELVKPKLKEIGLVTKQGDDENTIRLRAILLGLDYYAETLENLQALAKMYDRDYDALDAEIREDIIGAKLYVEPQKIDEYLEDYQKIADPEIKFELLFAGALSKDEKVLDKMMELLNKPDVVKPQDQMHLFVYLYRNPKTRAKVGEWLAKNWDYVKKMMGDKSLDGYPRYMANIIRNENEYEVWRDLFMPMMGDPALSRAIRIGDKEVKARLELIATDKQALYDII